jgi:hypothetical protein
VVGLYRFMFFFAGFGVERGVGGGGDAAHHALMEVAELLSAESGGATTDSGDFDVGADFDIGMNWHTGPLDKFLVVAS